MGPYNKGSPVSILKNMAQFQVLKPPTQGDVRKSFSNATKLRNKSKAWEVHRSQNHNLMLEKGADNVTTRDHSVAIILELAATTLMTLRMKELSKCREDFFPLNDPNWLEEDDLISIDGSYELTTHVEEDDITTAIDRITKAIKFEYVDDGCPKSRNGGFEDDYQDDEDLARRVMTHYYKRVAGEGKKDHRKFFEKIGRLFSENIKMLKRNNLHYSIYLMSRNQAEEFNSRMTDQEKERIIRREVNPNHRNSYLTIIGYENCKNDAKIIERLRDGILRKQAIANKNYFKVKIRSRE